MAIIFGLLLGVALLMGMLFFRSRCCCCPSLATTQGPFAWPEIPERSPSNPPSP